MDRLSRIVLCIVCFFIVYLFINHFYSSTPFWTFIKRDTVTLPRTIHIEDTSKGWISSSLYQQLNSYIDARNLNNRHIKKTFIIKNNTAINIPLNHDYIQLLNNVQNKQYPYSSWKCSQTSNSDYQTSGGYCVLTNIYYQTTTDTYYFFQNSSELNKDLQKDTFMAPYGPFKLTITHDIEQIKSLKHSAVLTRPLLIAHPPDENYAHGFLETCGPRFWTLAECQSNPSFINPSKIQIYYTSYMFNHIQNWNNYQQQTDATFLPTRKWEEMIQSMFSIYPLLTYRSFNHLTVLFQYALFTGTNKPRGAVWGHHYESRPTKIVSFPTINYRRAYLSYSEWILNSFSLTSKFQLTPIQKHLQKNQLSEEFTVCDANCPPTEQSNATTDEFTGEWIVVLNRAGAGRREILNADDLVRGLLKAFPDRRNRYLRVWPKQFNFDSNLYNSARMARSIRLLIGVHGAGLSNTLFMRPGAILYEINPYGCRHLSFNFKRWAEVFDLKHALWIPLEGASGRQDESCHRNSATIVNVKDIVNEVKGLLKDEMEHRDGYIRRALKIVADTSIVDHPPSGFENIL